MCAGLPYDEAREAMTANPANQAGIGDRAGSLAAGKDGDAVIWTRDPLTVIGADAYVTVIDRKTVRRAEVELF